MQNNVSAPNSHLSIQNFHCGIILLYEVVQTEDSTPASQISNH